MKTTTTTEPGEKRSSGLRERQKRARRERIQASAARLVRERGIEGTTINEIAALSDVSPATVFNYFASKDDLLLALLTDEQEDWMRAVAMFPVEPGADLVRQVCRLYVSISESSLQHYEKAFWRHIEAARIASPESPVVRGYDATVEKLRGELRRQLRRLVDAGIAPPALATRALAAFLYNHWVDLFTELMRNEDLSMADHRRAFEADVAILLDALKTADPATDGDRHADTDR